MTQNTCFKNAYREVDYQYNILNNIKMVTKINKNNKNKLNKKYKKK